MANPILQSRIKGEEQAEKFARDVGAIIDRPVNSVYITAGAQAGTDRVLTLQVRDRAKNVRLGRHVVALWAANTSGGAPGGSVTLASPSAGSLIQSTANLFVYITDANGQVVVTVTSTAATRYFEAVWLGSPRETALTWT